MKNLLFLLMFLLTVVYSHKSEALGIADQKQTVHKDSVKSELVKARSYMMKGNSSEATKIYLRIMESQPDNNEAVQGWLMANMKRAPGGEEEAIKQLEELSKLYPGNISILFFKAFLETEYKHNEEALADIDKVIKAQPDTAVNYVLKGQVLSGMGNHKDAIQAFDKATILNPKRSDVWGMKAGELAKTGSYDAAITAANKGLELTPDNPTAIYNRACIYCLKGDRTNALADLKKAISLNPSFKDYAIKDGDFKGLYDDEDFKKLTL